MSIYKIDDKTSKQEKPSKDDMRAAQRPNVTLRMSVISGGHSISLPSRVALALRQGWVELLGLNIGNSWAVRSALSQAVLD